MSKKLFPTNVLNQGKNILDAWRQIDDQLAFGPMNTAALTSEANKILGRHSLSNGISTPLGGVCNSLHSAAERIY